MAIGVPPTPPSSLLPLAPPLPFQNQILPLSAVGVWAHVRHVWFLLCIPSHELPSPKTTGEGFRPLPFLSSFAKLIVWVGGGLSNLLACAQRQLSTTADGPDRPSRGRAPAMGTARIRRAPQGRSSGPLGGTSRDPRRPAWPSGRAPPSTWCSPGAPSRPSRPGTGPSRRRRRRGATGCGTAGMRLRLHGTGKENRPILVTAKGPDAWGNARAPRRDTLSGSRPVFPLENPHPATDHARGTPAGLLAFGMTWTYFQTTASPLRWCGRTLLARRRWQTRLGASLGAESLGRRRSGSSHSLPKLGLSRSGKT